MSATTSSGKWRAPARSRIVVCGCAPDRTRRAAIRSPPARVTPVTAPPATSIDATPAAGDFDRRHLRAGAHLCAVRAGGAGEREADRAHAASHVGPGPAGAVEPAMEQVVRGARGARPGPDSHDARRREAALQGVVLEPLVEEVADRHRHEPDQLVR